MVQSRDRSRGSAGDSGGLTATRPGVLAASFGSIGFVNAERVRRPRGEMTERAAGDSG